jgi:anti-sigma B factor antagonist
VALVEHQNYVEGFVELDVDESRVPFTVVSLAGEIDLAVAPDLRVELLELVELGHHQVIVDLSAVEFVDSTGISVLVHLLNRLRSKGGVLRVVVTEPHIRNVFEITGLIEALSIRDSLESALEA